NIGIRASSPGADSNGADSNGYGPIKLYSTPELGDKGDPNEITTTVSSGGIVQLVNKQQANEQSPWVQVRLCSIASGESLSVAPAETDSADLPELSEDPARAAAPLNTPESTRALLLEVGDAGWVRESNLMRNSEPIQDLQPDQKENCES
ncbi:MAG: hypothetical protein AAFY72_14180, partial [Cyanobacteria bacterium J06649_4]